MKNILILCLILILSGCISNQSDSYSKLKKGFANPPVEARPRALWPWVDGNFDLEEITHEMEEAKRMGLGGFDIWDVWSVVDEEKKITPGPAFMSDEYLVGICHAINEAKRLGLDLGLIISSGWNAGGSWTTPEHQTMGIFHSDTLVKGPLKAGLQLRFPDFPGHGKPLRYAIIKLDEKGLPVYYKTIAVLAIRQSGTNILSPENDIIDLSAFADKKGQLQAELPKGNWNIQWFVCTNTGEPMIASTPNSKGPMIDHFSPEASEAHINYFINRIEKALGRPIANSGLKYFYTDSYEVKGDLWTPAMTEEFQKRKGYSMIPFLPVFTNQVVGDQDLTDRFRFDYQQVLSDLIIESHYLKTREICEAHGVGFVAEAAGPGMPIHNCPFESLKSSGSLSFPRGEFWHLPNNSKYWQDMRNSDKSSHYLNELQVIKGVASASHIYNRKFVEAEAFTGTHLWNEGPGDLKPTLDRALCEGLNRIIFHTWPHTPKAAGTPGWVYAFGTIMNENRIWWPMVKPFMDYTGRSSYLLQEGVFTADVLFYYGDMAPNFAPPKSLKPGLGFGYDYDYINSDVLLNKLNFEDGKLRLPEGQNYRILVLPESVTMNPDVLEKVSNLIKAGAIVVGPKPEKSHGLLNRDVNDRKIQDLAEVIWGDNNFEDKAFRQVGKGKIYSKLPLKQVLEENGIPQDFSFAGDNPETELDYIHRTIGDVEVYFIRNTNETQKLRGTAKFRCAGKEAEVWDPETGNISEIRHFNISDGITQIPLVLEPLESRFIVISGKFSGKELINRDEAVYSPDKKVVNEVNFNSKWTIDFPTERKGPGKIVVDSLKWWNDFPEDGIRFFSGIAVYENSFEMKEALNEHESLELRFGDLAEMAQVYINGEFAGTIWHSPFRLEISKALKRGENRIEIKVANTWANRLCGDARLPKEERISNTNVVRLPNAWSYPMKDIPLNEYPLINSGISGGIQLFVIEEK